MRKIDKFKIKKEVWQQLNLPGDNVFIKTKDVKGDKHIVEFSNGLSQINDMFFINNFKKGDIEIIEGESEKY